MRRPLLESVLTLLMVLLPVAALPVAAQESPRRAVAHQHSIATAQLSLEAGRLDLLLQIPGANLVGFEHPPRDDLQRDRLQQAIRRLQDGGWLRLPERAGCSIVIEIGASGFAPDRAQSSAHDHASDQDQDHGEDHDHAEFLVTAAADCARPAALGWIELDLFDGWPDNRSLQLDALTDRGAQRIVLSAARTRVELR